MGTHAFPRGLYSEPVSAESLHTLPLPIHACLYCLCPSLGRIDRGFGLVGSKAEIKAFAPGPARRLENLVVADIIWWRLGESAEIIESTAMTPGRYEPIVEGREYFTLVGNGRRFIQDAYQAFTTRLLRPARPSRLNL